MSAVLIYQKNAEILPSVAQTIPKESYLTIRFLK